MPPVQRGLPDSNHSIEIDAVLYVKRAQLEKSGEWIDFWSNEASETGYRTARKSYTKLEKGHLW